MDEIERLIVKTIEENRKDVIISVKQEMSNRPDKSLFKKVSFYP